MTNTLRPCGGNGAATGQEQVCRLPAAAVARCRMSDPELSRRPLRHISAGRQSGNQEREQGIQPRPRPLSSPTFRAAPVLGRRPRWRRPRRLPRSANSARRRTARSERVAQYGPGGARRLLRSVGLCAARQSGDRRWPRTANCVASVSARRSALPMARLRSKARHLSHQEPNAPIFVFIHGGAWLHGNARTRLCGRDLCECRRALRRAGFYRR